MRRIAALTALAVVVLASCGRGGQVNLLGADELPQDLYGDEEPGSATSRELTVTVYFVRVAEDLEQSTLEPVRRTGETDRTEAEFAMRQLLRGPDEREATSGLGTAIPSGQRTAAGQQLPATRLIEVSTDGDIVSVNVDGEFEAPDDDYIHILRIAQVVWTLTELQEVDRVRFLIHGLPQPVIDQAGNAHEVVSRARYSRLAPRAEEAEFDPCPLTDEC